VGNKRKARSLDGFATHRSCVATAKADIGTKKGSRREEEYEEEEEVEL
jgi:hypothetical protein